MINLNTLSASPPLTLGAQYVLELRFEEYKAGVSIDHDALAILMMQAIQEKLDSIQLMKDGKQNPLIMKTTVGSVCYETDYPISNPEDL